MWLSSLLLIHVAAKGLLDEPIVGNGFTSLDGSWTASTSLTDCTFVAGTDYSPGPIHTTAPANTPEECCAACEQDANCAAGVLFETKCYFKTAEEVKHPVLARGRTACVPKSGTPRTISMPATVPGDLISDLYRAKHIPDPWYELNWKNSTLWDSHNWTYTRSFSLSKERLEVLRAGAGADTMLVFDGIKMAGIIRLNGVEIGFAQDQFLRYEFSLGAMASLLSEANTVSVSFPSRKSIDARFMACAGGWDWAAYSDTSNPGGTRTFSKGIWKSVYLVDIDAGSAAITHLVPHVFYTGDFPIVPLTAHKHADFNVTVRVHTWAPEATKGTLHVHGEWGADRSVSLDIKKGNSSSTVTLTASATDISLWWPAGMGQQPRYNVTASLTVQGGGSGPIAVTRKIGFRFFAVVTGNDTSPGYVEANKGKDGSDSHGMMFRVNGAALWSRGANMIPMEEMEGFSDAEAHRILVQSSVDAGMNTLRVWGGGIFQYDAWYDACDELGVIVYHDMQYAQGNHDPKVTATQDAELRHQIRRLSHHPSIMLWDGCNECHVIIGTPTGIYATFVLTVVSEEDQSRVLWPSCPANGWKAGVDRLSALPNGSPLGLLPQATHPSQVQSLAPHAHAHATRDHTVGVRGAEAHGVFSYDPNAALEVHGPYQHGGGMPAVNGATEIIPFDPNIPTPITPQQTGPEFPSVFKSEFGSSVFSSFESMSVTLDESHWGLHAGQPNDNCTGEWDKHCNQINVMAERNYPCDNIILVYFGGQPSDFDKVGKAIFQKHLWQCLMGQALLIKARVEEFRGENTFGTVIWQLGEIWPTGGWGSLEWGRPETAGQVVGGRWKPLHHMLAGSTFRDQLCTCGTDNHCYVKNDSPWAFTGTVIINAIDLASGNSSILHSAELDMAAGPGRTSFFDIPPVNAKTTILTSTILNAQGNTVSANIIPLLPPKDLSLAPASVSATVGDSVNPDGSIDVDLATDRPALYVTLTTAAQGRFSSNVLLLLPADGAQVHFQSFGKPDLARLKASLRVEHAALYL